MTRWRVVFAATVAVLSVIVLGALFGRGAALLSQKSDVGFWSGVVVLTAAALLAVGLGFYVETVVRMLVRHHVEVKLSERVVINNVGQEQGRSGVRDAVHDQRILRHRKKHR